MPQPAQPTNNYPQKIEYVYVYTVEMKREVQSVAAEIQAIKAGLRLRDAELQRDVAQMKLQIEQMRRLQAQRTTGSSKSNCPTVMNGSDY
jgi:hypothetical protein